MTLHQLLGICQQSTRNSSILHLDKITGSSLISEMCKLPIPLRLSKNSHSKCFPSKFTLLPQQLHVTATQNHCKKYERNKIKTLTRAFSGLHSICFTLEALPNNFVLEAFLSTSSKPPSYLCGNPIS